MNPTYKIHYLGCKTNQSDAMSYAGVLRQAGWKEATGRQSPSLLLVQTCTVTMSADAQGRQLARKLRRNYPESRILLTGCYAQRAESELREMPEVDYVIGNLNPERFKLLSEIAGTPIQPSYPDFPWPGEFSRTRPYIKIQDGCDARCSYCIIPSVRGKSRSLPEDEVIRRICFLKDLGYREMILTGISMGGYGKDLAPPTSLTDLMTRIERLPGDFKIRLSSVEPEEINTDFVDVFASASRFQPHLHLPLQSASDTVLKKMRRQYLSDHYRKIVDRLYCRRPEVNLGTDLLVGFPLEDDAAFEETRAYVEDAPFAYCHVFPYSPRPDTPAAEYERVVPHQVVSERSAVLRDLSARKNRQYRQSFVGQARQGLRLYGTDQVLTDNYIRVRVSDTSKMMLNQFLSVRIDSADESFCYGRVLGVEEDFGENHKATKGIEKIQMN